MPRIVKEFDLSQGHCWPPTLPIAANGASVLIDGFRSVVVGDSYIPHIPGCTAPPTTHPVNTVIGSNNVFINGSPVVRDGDPLSCGDVANSKGGTVFANGGGLGGPAAANDDGATTGYAVLAPFSEIPDTLFIKYRRIILSTDPYEEIFLGGCPVNIRFNTYTRLQEETTNNIFANDPIEGGINLPSYAPDSARNPIPITNISLINASTGESIKDTPYLGLTFNPLTFTITGAINTNQHSEIPLRFSCSNFVGNFSKNFTLSINGVNNC